MTAADRLSLTLAAISILGLPSLALLWRAAVKLTQVQSRLESIAADLGDLSTRNDGEHDAMRDRLTYMERSELDYYRGQAAQPSTGRHT
jgi:hypothetical protein